MAQTYQSLLKNILPILFLCWHAPVWAQSTIGLEVISATAQPEMTSYSLDDLDAMEQVSFRTSTIWTDGDVMFSGVPLEALIAQEDVSGSAVEMTALNDYKVVMPLTELDGAVPIVATRMDGDPMPVREKGPYWVVFPYDLDTKYQSETVYSYSIWQLKRLKVVD